VSSPVRHVTYVGGPLDGEAEWMELVASPDGWSWALPPEVSIAPFDPRSVHLYRLEEVTAVYRYVGPLRQEKR
jgi:hypothetical protein